MARLEGDFDVDYDIENADGVVFGEIFYLNYYGVNVFFYVCGVSKYKVRIFELAKKKLIVQGVSAEILAPGLKPTSAPLVVLENNCWTKSNFWVDTNKQHQLEIPVNVFDPLYNEALELGVEYPVTGAACAVSLIKEQKTGIERYCWPRRKKARKKNKNFFNNRA